MEGREISQGQEHMEMGVRPEVHSMEALTQKGLSADVAAQFIERDQSILDLWEAANDPESLGH